MEFANSHPPEYANDGKTSTFWVSAIDKGDVSLQVDLQDQYEVRVTLRRRRINLALSIFSPISGMLARS